MSNLMRNNWHPSLPRIISDVFGDSDGFLLFPQTSPMSFVGCKGCKNIPNIQIKSQQFPQLAGFYFLSIICCLYQCCETIIVVSGRISNAAFLFILYKAHAKIAFHLVFLHVFARGHAESQHRIFRPLLLHSLYEKSLFGDKDNHFILFLQTIRAIFLYYRLSLREKVYIICHLSLLEYNSLLYS